MSAVEKKYTLKKAKTHKGRLHLAAKMPKMFEDPKNCIFIHTKSSSELTSLAVSELYMTRKSFSSKVNTKADVTNVFENQEDIEAQCDKANASLFVYSTDTKKRPMNLVFGNTFDRKLLDAFEFEITNFIPQEYLEAKIEFEPNCQPILVFIGEKFETDSVFQRFKIFMMDFYMQDRLKEVNITDLKRVITFVSTPDDKILIRNYQASSIGEYSLKKMNLEEVGPSYDLKKRRNHLSSDDDFKLACKQPSLIKGINKKNKENTLLGVKAKVFTAKQNLNVLSLKRYDKILGKKRKNDSKPVEKKEIDKQV